MHCYSAIPAKEPSRICTGLFRFADGRLTTLAYDSSSYPMARILSRFRIYLCHNPASKCCSPTQPVCVASLVVVAEA